MDQIKAVFDLLKYGVILLIVYILINFFTPMTTSLSNLMDRLAPPPSVDVMSSRVIINSLRDIGKLVTVTSEPHVRKIRIELNQGLFGLTSYGADHIAEGIIEAGIDFTKVRGDSLRCEESCSLLVPQPSITNCIIVRLRQTDQSFAIGGRDWELLEELGRYEAIKLFMEDVEGLGILEEAREGTEVLLGEFVSTLVEKPVDIVFEENDDSVELPETCKPDLPFGYVRDDDTGEWSRNE